MLHHSDNREIPNIAYKKVKIIPDIFGYTGGGGVGVNCMSKSTIKSES
jgi:hypothetical protein